MHNETPVLVLMSGNDEVNETKLQTVLGGEVRPCHPEELNAISGADAGSIGPIGFSHKVIADLRLKGGNDLYSGANKNDFHIGGIDLVRDVPSVEYFDLRTVEAGEPCPSCKSKIDVFKAIELGHIFKLGTKYSEALGAMFLDENGKENPIIMGSYGIGVDRILACFIEQSYDEKGIVWNKTLAPFQIHLIGLNLKNENVTKNCEKIYSELNSNGLDVLYDDRDTSAGFKFNDADLIGIPLQVVVGEKKLKENKCEVKIRKTGERFDIEVGELNNEIKDLLDSFL